MQCRRFGAQTSKPRSVGDLGLRPQSLARLAGMIEVDTISVSSSVPIFEAMVQTGKEPEVLAEELNLIQKSDAGELEAIVDQVLAENPKAVEDVTGGGKKSKKAKGFLLGQVQKARQIRKSFPKFSLKSLVKCYPCSRYKVLPMY